MLLAGALLALGFVSQLSVRSFAPIIHDLKLTGAHQPITQAPVFGTGHVQDGMLGAHALGGGAQLGARCLCRAGSALAHDRGPLIDALVAQPMQSIEGVAVTHRASVAKPELANRRWPNAENYSDYSPSAERECHSWRLFTSSPRLAKSELTSSASTAAAPAAMVVKYGTLESSALRRIE